jgi:hypothetical protein
MRSCCILSYQGSFDTFFCSSLELLVSPSRLYCLVLEGSFEFFSPTISLSPILQGANRMIDIVKILIPFFAPLMFRH